MVEWVIATDSHPGHDRIGHQPEHLNGLAVTIRVRDCLQRQRAHGQQQVVTRIDHLFSNGVPDRDIALSVELFYGNRFSVDQSVLCQAVDRSPCALVQQHGRSMLEETDMRHASGHGGPPSKIGEQ